MRIHRLLASAALLAVMASGPVSAAETPLRLAPPEIAAKASGGAGAGTSGVKGIQSTTLSGDPEKAGLYTIRVSVPAHTTIQAHTHKDERSATVVSGTWSIGYGDKFDPKALKALPPGGFYTEPAGVAHFAQTGDTAVVVFITGYGPTDTVYVSTNHDPRGH